MIKVEETLRYQHLKNSYQRNQLKYPNFTDMSNVLYARTRQI